LHMIPIMAACFFFPPPGTGGPAKRNAKEGSGSGVPPLVLVNLRQRPALSEVEGELAPTFTGVPAKRNAKVGAGSTP
jgi:hypothetical protein